MRVDEAVPLGLKYINGIYRNSAGLLCPSWVELMTISDRVRCRGSTTDIHGGKKETLRGIWLRIQPQGPHAVVDAGVEKACRHISWFRRATESSYS